MGGPIPSEPATMYFAVQHRYIRGPRCGAAKERSGRRIGAWRSLGGEAGGNPWGSKGRRRNTTDASGARS